MQYFPPQLFLNTLCNLQNCNILTEIDTERLFCNLPEIYAANKVFWEESVHVVVTTARRTGELMDPDIMLDGFLKASDRQKDFLKEGERYKVVSKAGLGLDSTNRLVD
jgi:hypothetical protein